MAGSKSFHQNLTSSIHNNKAINGLNGEQPSPGERSGHCLVSNVSYLYLFGGFNEPSTVYQDLWRYDISTGLWEELQDVEDQAPECTISSSMVIIEHNLFVFGGTSIPFSKKNSNTLHVYDLRKKRWFNVNEMTKQRLDKEKYPSNHFKVKVCGCKKLYDNVPTAKYGQSMVFIPNNRKIYIFSGTLGTTFTEEQHSFDLKKFRWIEYKFCADHERTVDRTTKGRYKAEAITDDDGRIYLMGGANLDTYFGFQTIDVFDTKQEKWEIVTTRSNEFLPRKNDNNNTTNNDNGDSNNDEIKKMVFPCPRKAHTCVKSRNSVYLFGGLFTAFKPDGTKINRIYNDVWKLDLTKKVWTKIPEVRTNNIRVV